jgi:hypothetical protein
VCGGDCEADENQNGICDDEDLGGCTDITNPGYDPAATFDDGSCLIGGCTIESACNYDPDADYQLAASCEFASCTGCTDVAACNYDSEASIDNGSCSYAEEFFDCDGNCINDMDGDGLCDEQEVYGCTDSTNPAYDPSATEDDGSCLVPGCLLPFACNYDPDADYIIISLCDFESCTGCTNEEACNYDSTAIINNASSCVFPSVSFLDCEGNCENDADGDGVCDEQEIPGCTDEAAINFNPFATDDNGSCIVLTGGCVLPFACNYDADADFYVPGSCDFSCLYGSGEGDCTNEMACNYGAENEPCIFFNEEGETCISGGCTVEAACNYDVNALYNDGSCDYMTCQTFGCNVEAACNYDNNVTVNDGTCEYESCIEVVEGCTNPMACNYDEAATSSNGSCDFESCNGLGCTDVNACNFDAEATLNDGSCVSPMSGFDCDGNCVVDSDGDGVCDVNEVGGCTDMGANNFEPEATDNDGTCTYDWEGCMSTDACNFNYMATMDNGTCDYGCYGCMNENACNFDANATMHDYTLCSYMVEYGILGADEVVLEEEQTYVYPHTAGSDYVWNIEGGVIVDGQGSSEIEVVWLTSEGLLTVQETNMDGCTGDVVTFDVTGTASELAEIAVTFSAFPNPANDLVVVVTNGFGDHAFQVMDAAGRIVISERLVAGRNMINVAHLANGTYRMVLDQANGRQVKQLVIAH